MLYACATALGCTVDRRYGEIVAGLDDRSEQHPVTTVEEAQTAWEKTLKDSQEAARDGGDEF